MAGEVLKQTMPPTWHLAKNEHKCTYTKKKRGWGKWGKTKDLTNSGFRLKALISSTIYNDLYFPFKFKLVL